jgi:opacity protein-like surface antigen
MKLKLALAAALALIVSTASAQPLTNPNRSADLMNQQVLDSLKATPVAQPAATVPASGSSLGLSGVYLGANAGSNFRDGQDYVLGGVVGYQFHRNFAGELTYDYARMAGGGDGQMVMGNLVASQRLSILPITPYALVGAGVGWNAYGSTNDGGNTALYNVGGGVRINLVKNVDLDARYRYVGAFNTNESSYAQHVVTGGLNIRF